jgi:hypothetical protein
MRFLLILSFVLFSSGSLILQAEEAPAWQPEHTWVFAIGCTVWKHDRSMNMPKEGREDTQLMDVFKQRGVPNDQIVFLKDKAGTLANIKKSFTAELSKTHAGDTLIFYFQGHGSRDVKKNGQSVYYFCNYDCDDNDDDSFLYMKDVYEIIENNFKGDKALMLADCCCSGGLAKVAATRHTKIAYCCLDSTFAHNLSTGEWTYTDALIKGFRGDPIADLNDNGALNLRELAQYTEKRMAFVEEQKAVFATFNGFNPLLQIAKPKSTLKLPTDRFVDAKWDDDRWYKAEITEAKPGKFHVNYVVDGTDGWVKPDHIREHKDKQFDVGTPVLARCEEDDDKWKPATVVRAWYGLHYVHFDGDTKGSLSEWEPPDRVKLKKK